MMIIAQTMEYVAPALNVGVVVGIIWWFNRCKVSKDTCNRTYSSIKDDFSNLRDYIGDVEDRAKERHDELKQLIKNNGNDKPKVIT
jgi:hypothetical protein